MNRNSRIGFALLGFCAGALVFYFSRDEGPKAPAAGPAASGIAVDTTTDTPTSTTLEAPAAIPSAATREAAQLDLVDDSQPQPAHEPRCVLFARVVNEVGAPVSGAEVVLAGYKSWSDGDGGTLVDPRIDYRGFRVETDLDGRFRFEVPPPAVARQRLQIRPSRFIDSFERYFGEGSRGNEPGLVAGERDLGELRLATTGAITGRVVDDLGRPIEGVELGTGGSRGTTYSRGGWSDAAGRFEIPHAPVGTYGVSAKKEGRLSEFRDGVTVEAARETSGIELVLGQAPTIEGRVLDPSGAPVAGVKLWGWPQSSGSGAGGRSGDDGRFSVTLPQDEPYTLEAKRDGYSTWGEGRSQLFEPGTRDLEIVMEPIERTRFRVVDAETEAPLMRFGVDVLEDNGSKSPRRSHTERRRPTVADREEGVVALTARPGIDLYVAAADGYSMAFGDVEHDASGEPEQTIRLRRAAVVMGRALQGGVPVANAPVRLEIVTSEKPGQRLFGSPSADEAAAQRRSPAWFRTKDNGAVNGRTDDAGRFALSPVDSGLLRLTVDVGRGGSIQRQPLQVELGATLDVGDLEAIATGAIEGTIRPPLGVSPGGLVVYLDNWKDDVTATADDRGRYRFVDVHPGVHSLQLDSRPGQIDSPPNVVVEVSAGATVTADLDATDYGMCTVRVRVTGAGQEALAGATVQPSWQDKALAPKISPQVGELDEAGRAEGTLRAKGLVSFGLRTREGISLSFREPILDLGSASEHEVELAVELGAVTLTLPAGLDLPKNASSNVTSEGSTTGGVAFSQHRRGPWRTFDLALVPVGRQSLAVKVCDPDAPMTKEVLPDGRSRYSTAVVYETAVQVDVVAGGHANMELR